MNTHPNTPPGKFLDSIGLWHPHFGGGIAAIYDQLHTSEKAAIEKGSGLISIINANLQATPDFIFGVISQKFPDLTKEHLTEWLNKANTAILKVDAGVPEDFDAALTKLQGYLSQYTGNTWASITRAAVEIGIDIFLNGTSPNSIIATVLDYAYRTFIKGKIA